MLLEVKDLHVELDGNEILKGVNLKIAKGEVIALMGPNGAGKSTLANALMGHPGYKITSGRIFFNSKDITKLKPHKKAQKGMFLSFQHPSEIEGVSIPAFLRTAYNSIKGKSIPIPEFLKLMEERMQLLGINKALLKRHLNENFSGGEKKRMEILQMAVLQPKLAILDETDSGLDVDALKTVATGINKLKNPSMGLLLITHYQRILHYIKPDKVYVMIDGKIVKSGGCEVAEEIERKGYEAVK
jgi:Fe-S cluster assembly ATP-binding protein